MQFFLQDKVFKYITVILILVSLILIIKEVFFTPRAMEATDLNFPTPPIDIKIDVFDKFDIGSLTPFEQITPTELIGRDNPFEPYSLEEYEKALEEFLANATGTITTTTLDIATTTLDVTTTTDEVATTTEEIATTT